MPPTLVWLTRRALERGRRNPRRGDGRLFHARPGLCRDVRIAGPITSVAIGPVQPSPLSQPSRALHRHPLRCGGTERQDAVMPAAVRPTASHQLHPRTGIQTTTKREAPTPPPSKPLLGGHRTRHDAPSEVRFARTAVYSTALCAIPLHVNRIVRHACKLPPP
jgi:hypothetical protein